MDKELRQYFTKHNNSNNKADKEDTLNNFKAFIISINNAQEPDPLKNIKYFLILFGLLICDNIIQVITYLADQSFKYSLTEI